MHFLIPGKPQAKQRPRHGLNGAVYTPKKTTEYEKLVRQCYEIVKGPKYEEPIEVIIRAMFKPPRSASKKAREEMISNVFYDKKPDADNIAKIIMDALNGVAWDDDKQVVSLVVIKQYRREDGVMVTIQPFEKMVSA